jgi:hypothetical protein
MSLRRWSTEGRLRSHVARQSEVSLLLASVERDLADAQISELSPDRRFATAYSTALGLATIALRSSGYRAVGVGHHEVTILSLPHTMGSAATDRSRYLNACRTKRNHVDYDGVGYATDADADELISDAGVFREELIAWLTEQHPELIG